MERVPSERFREIVGTGFIFTRRQDGYNMWVAASKKVEHALVQIVPYLVKYYSEGRKEIDRLQIAREIRMLNSNKGRRLEKFQISGLGEVTTLQIVQQGSSRNSGNQRINCPRGNQV